MIALDLLEQNFLAHVRCGAGFPREWCAQGLVGSDIGLAIYANAYHARLCEALESDHPQLAAYLGDALWTEFCSGYIATHPSNVRSLRHFGAHVPSWLDLQTPFSEYPAIAELAAFERALLDVFDAADGERIDWSALQLLDLAAWPGMRLRFHPSVRLLTTKTNAVEIWRALKDAQPPPEASASSVRARLLWRDEERISRFRSIEANELVALRSLLSERKSFAESCEKLAAIGDADEVPAMALGFLRQWLAEGIISQLDIARDSAPTPR